jgi:hypothetical protein
MKTQAATPAARQTARQTARTVWDYIAAYGLDLASNVDDARASGLDSASATDAITGLVSAARDSGAWSDLAGETEVFFSRMPR